MSHPSERSTQRQNGAWRNRLLAMGLSAAALALAWTLWGTSVFQSGQADRHLGVKPSPSSTAAPTYVAAAPSASPVSLPSPGLSPSSTPSTKPAPPTAPVTLHQTSPEIDLATRAHLALQSGTAEEAHTVATDISMCSDFEGVVALAYKLPLKNNPINQFVLNDTLEQQRRCQALDSAAKALYEPLLLKAFEGGSRNAARSMATKPNLLAQFSPEQKARVAQAVKDAAAQGEVSSIHLLSNASASLGTSLRDDYAYALAFKALRLDQDRDSRYFEIFPNEYIAVWDEELKLTEQQLSKAEIEQARQQAEAVLRSYREARLKKETKSTNPQ